MRVEQVGGEGSHMLQVVFTCLGDASMCLAVGDVTDYTRNH